MRMVLESFPSLGQIILIAIAGWGTLLACLAALWATNARASWLARLSPIGLLVAMLIPMGCFAFAGMFAAQAAIVLGFFALTRTVRCGLMKHHLSQNADGCQVPSGKPSRWRPQFTLGRLFATLLVCAIILGLVLKAPDEHEIIDLTTLAAWVSILLVGLGLATSTILAWLLVAARRWANAAAAVLGLFLMALLGELSGIASRLGAWLEITDQWLVVFAWIMTLTLALSCSLGLLAKAGWNWWPHTSSASRPSSLLARIAVVLIALILMLPTIDLGWAMVPPAPPPHAEPPKPNGYDLLAQIERKLNWNSITADDPSEASVSEATQFATDNQMYLSELTTTLKMPSQVVVDWRPGFPPSSPTNVYHDVLNAWHLAAKAARGSGDDCRAAECYLQALRASNFCANGGTAIDELVANALVIEATNELAGLLPQLSEDQIGCVQRGAYECLSDREPIEPIIDRSERHERITGGWPGRLSAWFVDRRLSDGWNAAVELPIHRAARDARLNLLIVECALHRYQLAHGSYPDTLAQLTPDFLQKVPRDPFGEGAFQYRRTDSGHLLYSIGRNRTDDGGVQSPDSRLEGDLLLTP